MNIPRKQEIKKAQREHQLLRELSQFLLQLSLDDKRLQGVFISRLALSADKSVCTVFFVAQDGHDQFKTILPVLILYRPSLRKALSAAIPGRFTPELVFKYDLLQEKHERIDALLDKISH